MKTEMEKLDRFMKENNIKAVGPKITTTYLISQAMVQTMDVASLFVFGYVKYGIMSLFDKSYMIQ